VPCLCRPKLRGHSSDETRDGSKRSSLFTAADIRRKKTTSREFRYYCCTVQAHIIGYMAASSKRRRAENTANKSRITFDVRIRRVRAIKIEWTRKTLQRRQREGDVIDTASPLLSGNVRGPPPFRTVLGLPAKYRVAAFIGLQLEHRPTL